MAGIVRRTLRGVWRPTRRFINNRLGPAGQIQLQANERRIRFGLYPRRINLRNPKRFTDKLLWLKLYERHDDAHIIADKVAVREYVRERVGPEVLIPLAAVYDDPEKILLEEFPEHFVIKPNHASGYVSFGSRANADRDQIIAMSRDWLKIEYGKDKGEYQYWNIPPKIMVEPDLRKTMNSASINDYKFFCFNGAPKFIQVDLDRFGSHRRHFYDLAWNRQSFRYWYPNTGEDIPRPEHLETMIDIATKLAEGRTFVRVDLYDINGNILFGEITFHPESGTAPITPDRYDFELGKLLTLPDLGRQ